MRARPYLALPSLAARFSADDNGFGFLRLMFALGVLVSHGWPLGLGQGSPGYDLTHGQDDLGESCVHGFFVLSGFLISGSAQRLSLGRFAWRRTLRIFPGLWVCLLLTAFVFAPVVAYLERGGLTGFWNAPDGPFAYVVVNWFSSMNQYPISGLLTDTPFGAINAGPSAFDGSLWTLHYELAAYAVLAILVTAGVLRRSPRLVLLLIAGCVAYIAVDEYLGAAWTLRPPEHGNVIIPVAGTFTDGMAVYLGYLFLLGVAARLFGHRLPMHGALAATAAAVMAGSLWLGGFLLVGLPCYAYLVLYASVALPRVLRRVGRRQDYSYGIYIYAFPVQQLIAVLGGVRYGVVVFLILSAIGTFALAVPSWHFVEAPALRLKRFNLKRVPGPPRPVEPEPAAVAAAADAGTA
jgi:peptidoglycan/LPS O-acetylase OafA/YrhL